MQAIFEKVHFPPDRSVRLSRITGFDQPGLQYHPEYELVYILKGKGLRLVAYQVEPFDAGDAILLGPNLPHWWRPNPGPREEEEAIVLQFGPSFFLPELMKLPEFRSISTLRESCSRGVSFEDSLDRQKILSLLLGLLEGEDTGLRWLGVMQLLKELSLMNSARKVLPDNFEGLSNEDALEKAIGYILENLSTPLHLEGVAQVAGLHPTHFSRRFKKSVGMSFPRFLRHHRIARLSQHLPTAKNLARLAHEHGFQNLSTFNRCFKEEMGCSPREYRSNFQTE